MKVIGNSHCPDSHHGSASCYAAENTKSHHAWERSYLLEFVMGWLSYFAPLGKGELLSLHWDPIVLLQANPVETNYAWNGTCTIEREEKVGFLVWHIPSQYTSIHLVTPGSAASPKTCMICTSRHVSKAANLPLLKARWARSLFCWYNHLATIFVFQADYLKGDEKPFTSPSRKDQ